MKKAELFSSRWALILSALGMAVGTGNIWRFPRIVAQNGGGSFLIPWIIFLFLWSIPLLMVEFAIGKETRKGTVGAFGKLLGEKYTWMGAFVGFLANVYTGNLFIAVLAGVGTGALLGALLAFMSMFRNPLRYFWARARGQRPTLPK